MTKPIARADVTLCLTIGKRPDDLARSLKSLFELLHFENVIAINDFGDEATNAVFRQLCPHGELISLGHNMGHHSAVDYMYAKIKTPYVLHTEDDWIFDAAPDFEKILPLLDHDPKITAVVLRKISDFHLGHEALRKVRYFEQGGLSLASLNNLHAQWHGFTFNPHIAKLELWKNHAPFARFKKERHISRFFRAQNRSVVYLKEGLCEHIGVQSVSNPPKKPSWWARCLNGWKKA